MQTLGKAVKKVSRAFPSQHRRSLRTSLICDWSNDKNGCTQATRLHRQQFIGFCQTIQYDCIENSKSKKLPHKTLLISMKCWATTQYIQLLKIFVISDPCTKFKLLKRRFLHILSRRKLTIDLWFNYFDLSIHTL